ncbi:lanthionine synthetase LanC family protein [Nonomuraea sp. NPDC050310]|uniref:lanthionine synthetase LanC family protein n=1 Tax=Nonomuraea sp. NPDC050310 TaxID=3154935 RepID=UPI0033CF4C5A
MTERSPSLARLGRLLGELPQVAPDAAMAIVGGALSGPDATRALTSWLRGLKHAPRGLGLFGGSAERLLNLRIAATALPKLAVPAAAQREALVAQLATTTWRDSEVGWADYDLIVGPSGTLVALASDPEVPASVRAPLTGHLLGLCAAPDLARLRIGAQQDDHLRRWNIGHVNLGLAHGLPGIMIALCAAAEADGLSDELATTLARLAGRLIAECRPDGRGVYAWPHASGVEFPSRPLQAWCYGCPSNAWVVWETARVLGDPELASFALEAAASFVTAYDDERDLRNLAICHGAAGVLLVFDAFARHTPLAGAQALAAHLHGYLLDRHEEVAELAATDWSLMNGAGGVLAALLTVEGGDRRWLATLGLR